VSTSSPRLPGGRAQVGLQQFRRRLHRAWRVRRILERHRPATLNASSEKSVSRYEPSFGTIVGTVSNDTVAARAWRASHPSDAATFLASSNAPWWIAGGWALDVFRGATSRSHADLDIGILRRDVSTVLLGFSNWDVYEAKAGRLAARCPPRLDVHSLWCRPTVGDPWTIELMLDESDGDTWVYRRDRRIRRSMATAIRHSPDGLPHLAPEIQLLYKSKAPRHRDEVDFAQIAPLLTADARRWLHDAIQLTAPDHKWIRDLRNYGAGARLDSESKG